MLADLIAIGVIPTGGAAVPTTPTSIDIDLVKSHLRVRHTDEDTLIAGYMASAQDYVEQRTGRLLTRREVTQEATSFPTKIALYWGPSPSGLTISYVGSDDVEADLTDARIVRGNAYAPADGWPSIAENTSIFLTYTAGYATDTVPAALIAAQLLLIGHWYDTRAGVSDKPMTEVPLAVGALLAPYSQLVV